MLSQHQKGIYVAATRYHQVGGLTNFNDSEVVITFYPYQ